MYFQPRSKGFTFIGILIALAIILILSGHYFKKDEETEKVYVQTQIDKSKTSACAMNRKTLESSITAWRISHPQEELTLDKLRRDRYSVPRCPDGSEYIIGSRDQVYCPIHFPPPGQVRSESQSQAGAIQPGGSPSAPAAATMDRVRKQLGQ